MDLKLVGKNALVTGSSKGIGFAIAEFLHSEGCCIVLNSRTKVELLDAATKLPGAFVAPGDVTYPQGAQSVVKNALEQVGELDILVCNVGGGHSVPPGQETAEEWQRVFALNLWSTTNTIEAAVQTLSRQQGSIVCVSSICGLEVIHGAPVTYSAAKAALHAFVRGISRPLGKKGIRINAVAPGNILFKGSVWERKLNEDAKTVEQMLLKEVSLGELGTPKDVAKTVAYLASPVAKYATGSIWTLDGGQVHS